MVTTCECRSWHKELPTSCADGLANLVNIPDLGICPQLPPAVCALSFDVAGVHYLRILN